MSVRVQHMLFMAMQGRHWMPRRMQIALRRRICRRVLERSQERWPIDEASGRPHTGWQGWPAGKRFAFVLTHDVDTQRGLDRCRRLMDMEEQLGFRSAFFFVPRGRYPVSADLIAEVKRRGFEVGVHGLYHDWWTFLSRRVFERRAPLIRQYVQEWGAVGFRAPSTVRHPGWIHELSVAYDSSVSDTDPFEPQPHGVGTIFPFRVMGRNGPGYVALPYTLPQDFTLFALLDQRGPAIWIEKLDWLARHGGLALMDTHPDYMAFDGARPRSDEYPVAYFRDFLKHVRDTYGTDCWTGQPQALVAALGPALPVRTLEPAQAHAASAVAAARPAIWIDLDNTPHVPFFKPIIRELERRGYQPVVTARDAFQVCDLAARMGVACTCVGRHHGKHRVLKLAGLFLRAFQLIPTARRARPVLAVSHGSRAQAIACRLMGIPSVMIGDYEYARTLPIMHADWAIVPQVIPPEALPWPLHRVRQYPGIKEDVYVPSMIPDPTLLDALGVPADAIVATVRPPATEAHYHKRESEVLFRAAMEYLCADPRTAVILLPRNRRQGDEIRGAHPDWFRDDKTRIPGQALDGISLLWASDLVISGGGTMNREAAVLALPVYSIFRGTIGAVDRHLAEQGSLVLLETEQDVRTRIRLVKRVRAGAGQPGARVTLDALVDHILACIPAPAIG